MVQYIVEDIRNYQEIGKISTSSFFNLRDEIVRSSFLDTDQWESYFRGPDIARVLDISEKNIYVICGEDYGGISLMKKVISEGKFVKSATVTPRVPWELDVWEYKGVTVVINSLDGIPALHCKEEDIEKII